MGKEGDLTWVLNTMQYTLDILQNCTLQDYTILVTNVTPNKFNFEKAHLENKKV